MRRRFDRGPPTLTSPAPPPHRKSWLRPCGQPRQQSTLHEHCMNIANINNTAFTLLMYYHRLFLSLTGKNTRSQGSSTQNLIAIHPSLSED